ncbi:branched-chain amino acid transport system ATP-binding protein [Bradyrhizobium sp. AZCC 1577]|uniref:ABC transporter ATP-binding protein n=1 Tax=Bradyrhizobium sp. AZCC 1577 TaxID=3117019 RepID=UPI002FEE8DB3
MLDVVGLSSRYGRIEVLHDVTMTVSAGHIVALIGANGAGKTTLLRAISGVQPISAGQITFKDKSLNGVKACARVKMGLSQSPEGRQVFAGLSVEDNLRLGGWTKSKADSNTGLQTAYQMFPILYEKKSLPAGSLSGGQQQMLAIARALMSQPDMLLLDEPSMGLSPLLIDQVFEAVCSLRDRGLTIVLVEQNANLALSIADQACVMETGRIVLKGTGSALQADPRVRELYLGDS